MKKLNSLGIGPKMAVVLLPWLAFTIIISSTGRTGLRYSSVNTNLLLIPGIIIMISGLMFYFSTVRKLLRGLKETRLLTEGPYGLCQHPLYASLLLLIIPALSLIINSWLVLTSSFVGYFLFKKHIGYEQKELEKFFGEEYLKYRNRTPELFPLSKRPFNL